MVADPGRGALGVLVQAHQPGGRHRRHGVHLGPERAQGGEQGLGVGLVGEDRHLHDDQVAAAQGLGDLRDRGQLQEPGDRGDRVGCGLGPGRPGRQHPVRLLPGPDQPAGDDLLQGEEAHLECGDDAEAAAAAAQGPEEIGLVAGVGAHEAAVGEDDLHGGQGVGSEPVAAAEPPHAAAQRVAGDADVGRGAVQRHQPVGGGRGHDVLPEGARLDVRGARHGVDAHLRHGARAHQDHVGEVAERSGVVAGPLGGHAQPERAGEGGDLADVAGVGRQGDRGRALVDGDVPGHPGGVVAAVAGEVELAVDGRAQRGEAGGRGVEGGGHGTLSWMRGGLRTAPPSTTGGRRLVGDPPGARP